MLTIVFAVSLVNIFILKQENVEKNNIEASAFSSGSGSSSDPYWITTYNNWRDFVSAVANGNSYSGKYINLGYNVDWFGNSVLPIGCKSTGTFSGTTTVFKGKFDGKGNTISNFTLKGMEFEDAIDYDINLKVNGLFGIIGDGAEIKNLSLNNFKVEMPIGDPINDVYVGGLVGQYSGSASATIKNCEIKNMEVIKSTGMSHYDKYIGAIIGRKASTGSLTLQDCYVENFKVSLNGEQFYSNYTIAKVGPAFCTYRGSSNVKNCLVNGASITTTSSRDTTIYEFADAPSGNLTVTSCYTSKQTTYSGWSIGAAGGLSGTTWYYFDSSYNSGWPKLRVFIDWKTINFSASTGGSVSPASIQIPSDSNPTAIKSGATIAILGQTSLATANSGYQFSSWTGSGTSYTANFVRLSTTLTFTNATGTSGDTISPVGTTSYTIYQGEPITASHTSGDGPLTLKYTFKNTSGTTCNVTYTIPAKYKLLNSNNPGSISSATTISPTLDIRTFNIKFNKVNGSDLVVSGTTQSSACTESVKYGQSITYTKNREDLSFIINGKTITYTALAGWRFDSITIVKDGSTSNIDTLSSVTGNISIVPTYAKWHTVSFATISNTTAPTSSQIIEVKGGESLTATLSSDQKTLIYTYNGASVEYKASQYYILSNDSNVLKILEDTTITPVAIFYACTVTMGNVDSEIGNIEGYTEPFVVEYSTEIEFEAKQINGKFTYTYTFTYNGVKIAEIKYIMNSEEYALKSEIKEKREWLTDITEKNLTEYEIKREDVGIAMEILPKFYLKQYAGELG